MNPIRLSHSSLNLLNSCERKFQLIKLLNNDLSRDESADLSFGTAFGIGCAHYLVHQNQEQAIFETWKAYYPVLEDDVKSQWTCIGALQSSFNYLDSLLEEYEVVQFQNKPAVELSFRLNIDPQFYFVGFIDIVLRHRLTGQYVVVDVKTTKLKLHDLSAKYANSDQGLGYSIALDQIVGEELASFGVMYLVLQIIGPGNVNIKPYLFEKTLSDRLNWFFTLGLDVEKIKQMQELNIFPIRGDKCLAYNRLCPFFGTCTLHSQDQPAAPEEDTTPYQFTYQIQDLIQDHIRRVKQ